MKTESRGKKTKPKENIWNVPNALTLLRVVITFVLFYFIFSGFDFRWIISLFVIGMITDFLDGQIARRFKLTTEFGRKFDMIADRMLMIGTVLALVVDMGVNGRINKWFGFQILIIMTREIISFPFALLAFLARKPIPKAKIIGKTTTVLQAITFPLILINIMVPTTEFSIYFSVITAIAGFFSALTYIRDLKELGVTS